MAISWVQIAIYQAAEWDIPSFAHIPLIFGGDGKKLSKRHGATGMSRRVVIQSFFKSVENLLSQILGLAYTKCTFSFRFWLSHDLNHFGYKHFLLY
jgi:hypothetical protein